MPVIANSPITNLIAASQSTATATPANTSAPVTPAPSVPPGNIDRNMSMLNGLTTTSFPEERPKYYFGMIVCQYSRQSLTSLGRLNPIAHYTLPLPEGLRDVNQVTYEQTPIGAFFGSIANAVVPKLKSNYESSQSISGALGGAASELLNTPGRDAFNGLGEVGTAIGLESTGRVGDAASAWLGLSPNQFLTILFKGPTYQQHSFAWKLAPNTYQEADTLRRMIKDLNNAKAPSLAVSGALFNFPMIFQLYFAPNAKFLYKFKPAVLEAVTVDYAPNGGVPPFLRSDVRQASLTATDNAPESIVLQMQFLQLEFELANNYNDNADPINFGS